MHNTVKRKGALIRVCTSELCPVVSSCSLKGGGSQRLGKVVREALHKKEHTWSQQNRETGISEGGAVRESPTRSRRE